MDYEKIAPSFGNWSRFFKNFIESDDMGELFGYIKKRVSQGMRVLPSSDKVFRCFQETDPDNLKCIICGIAPYHTTFIKDNKERVNVADGLALSCSSTWKEKGLQPSLEQIYQSWESDYSGFDIDLIYDGDLTYLAKQGVLLYNISLTVEENKPLSMNPAWEKFNHYFFIEVVNQYFRGLPIIFMGQQAHKSAKLLTPLLHYPILVSHPASASYNNAIWNSENCWKRVDEILWQNNKMRIKWYKTKKDNDEEDYPEWVTKPMIHGHENLPKAQDVQLPWIEE